MKLMRTIENDILNLDLVERFSVYGDEEDEKVEIRAYTNNSCYIVWSFELSPAESDLDFNTGVVDRVKHIELPKIAKWLRDNKDFDLFDAFCIYGGAENGVY